MKLNAKLVMIMLSLLVIAMFSLFALNQYSQNELVDEIQESSTEVSKAIQLSIADLTSESPYSSRLREYLKEAKRKGINEISIISNEGEIIDSSDPEKVGKRRDVKKLGKGLKASRTRTAGKTTEIDPSRLYDLVVPVIVGDEQLGYVHINLLLDNIRTIQHNNFMNRLAATVLVFMLGIVFTIFLARRYTRPIRRIVESVKKVAAGDLTQTLPVESGDEIGELSASFNEMVLKLREREQLEKRLFEAEHLSKVGQLAAGIAHEIRNPLNYISLAVDHLKEDIGQACPENGSTVEELLGKIKEEVRRANYMVINFMSYGRPLRLRTAAVSCAELVEKTLSALGEQRDDRRIEFVTDVPPDLPELQGDPELLRTCLVNLVANAIQATSESGRITLRVRFDAGTESFLLSVADEGIGIRAEDLPKIMQPYFTSREAGVGLGLAITERIVKEHGGTLTVASTAGSGAVFTITLPARRKEQEP